MSQTPRSSDDRRDAETPAYEPPAVEDLSDEEPAATAPGLFTRQPPA